MSDWTSGYVADIAYTYGYYPELNPLRVRLAFLNRGLVFPKIKDACELGYGQGLSINFHAASSDVTWAGTDFNPSQASFAQELARTSEAGAALYDQTFSEFARRPDLPGFDFIGLHGIWSWISDENRSTIVEFVKNKLNVGGVLYVSYNTFPGWAHFAPIRHLMTAHADVLGSEGRGIVSRIDGAIEFAEKLLRTNPMFLRANPLIAERLEKLKAHNRHYLAHEYFNKDWHPMHFSTMADMLTSAKLQYACSANFLDHIDSINLTVDQQKFLSEIPDTILRETTKDFMMNQQFRRDYWVKGARNLRPLEQLEEIRKTRVVLTVPRKDASLTISGTVGEVSMNPSIYEPVLDCLSDHKIRSIGELEALTKKCDIELKQLFQSLLVMVGTGYVSQAQDDSVIEQVKSRVVRVNSAILSRAKDSGDISFLVSPVISGGIMVNRFQQLFLLSKSVNVNSDSAQCAEWAWRVLEERGQKIVKDGKQIDTSEASIKELSSQANDFFATGIPVLEGLGISLKALKSLG